MLSLNASLVVMVLGTLLLAYAGPTDDSGGTSTQAAQIKAAIRWYGCWPDGPPKGAEPTHAIVTYRDGEPNIVSVVLARDIMRHPDENPGMALHALCP